MRCGSEEAPRGKNVISTVDAVIADSGDIKHPKLKEDAAYPIWQPTYRIFFTLSRSPVWWTAWKLNIRDSWQLFQDYHEITADYQDEVDDFVIFLRKLLLTKSIFVPDLQNFTWYIFSVSRGKVTGKTTFTLSRSGFSFFYDNYYKQFILYRILDLLCRVRVCIPKLVAYKPTYLSADWC